MLADALNKSSNSKNVVQARFMQGKPGEEAQKKRRMHQQTIRTAWAKGQITTD